MHYNNIIISSTSQLLSPLHIVTKKDDTFHLCGDYRQINAKTTPDRYRISRIEPSYFSITFLKIQLSILKLIYLKPTLKCPLSKKISVKQQLLLHLVCTSSMWWVSVWRMHQQHFINLLVKFFSGLDSPPPLPYLDDILIASTNEEQHNNHPKLVFGRLNDYGLRINVSDIRSVMGTQGIEFLWYLIVIYSSRLTSFTRQSSSQHYLQTSNNYSWTWNISRHD